LPAEPLAGLPSLIQARRDPRLFECALERGNRTP
jgi:hypothetical protein